MSQFTPLRLFDTHAHLDDPSLSDQLDQVLQRANQHGLEGVVAIGTTLESSRNCVQLAERFPQVWAAVGIQPNHCAEAFEGDWQGIEELARHKRVVAIGETGLDRYWDYTPWDLQLRYFLKHIQLSEQTGKPLVIHMRDCQSEMIDALEQTGCKSFNGIMHSYTGDGPGAQRFLELGLHISFAGMVTYKKSAELREVARSVPDDRLLVETDSPYLSPEPNRKHRPNEPWLVRHTVECLAEVRNTSAAQLAALTADNAKRVFAIAT